MSLSDPLGDMLTRIRNGQRAHMTSIESPASKLRSSVLEVLKREGYIRDFGVESQDGHPWLRVHLKYGPDGEQVLQYIQRVSKPGCRIYRGWRERLT